MKLSVTKTCTCCGADLPLDRFERYRSGSFRDICRHCHYLLHTRAATRRWRQRQREEHFLHYKIPKQPTA